MGTSHEEPMMRSLPPEWTLFGQGPWDYATNQKNVYDFWKAGAERARPYEGVFTMGMRGSGVYCVRAGIALMALTFSMRCECRRRLVTFVALKRINNLNVSNACSPDRWRNERPTSGEDHI